MIETQYEVPVQRQASCSLWGHSRLAAPRRPAGSQRRSCLGAGLCLHAHYTARYHTRCTSKNQKS